MVARAPRLAAIRALDGVTFTVEPGEVAALVGANGSGKSTLLRVLATLLLADAGTATVDGHDVTTDPIGVRRAAALVVADDRSFSLRLTGRENLEFFAALHGGLGRSHAALVVAGALERVGLTAAADDSYATYSTGMRQRLALARALAAGAPVLLLDEPFRALDAAAADVLRSVLAGAAADGVTAPVATHHVDELSGLCSRVIALEAGRVQLAGRS